MSDPLMVARNTLVRPDGTPVRPESDALQFKATVYEERNISADGVEPVYQRENPETVIAPYNLDALCKELVEKMPAEGKKKSLVLEVIPDDLPNMVISTAYDGDLRLFMTDMAKKVSSIPEVMQAIQGVVMHMGKFSPLSHVLVTVGFKESADAAVKTAGFGFVNIHLKPTKEDNKSFGATATNHTKSWVDKTVGPSGPEIIRP